MIHLTRLNNQSFVLNADLIKFIENSPDTVITLLTGEKLVVREPTEEVLKRIGEFQARFYRRAGPGLIFDTSLPGGEVESDARPGKHAKPSENEKP